MGWTLADWKIIMHDGRRYVPVENVAQFYGMKLTFGGNNAFKLAGGNRVLEGKSNTSEVMIDGVKYVLCFPISSKDNTPIISAMDVTKIIEPVLRPGKIANATQIRNVVLDAGHGGHDSGATGPFGREKDFAFDVAKRAKTLLEQRGFRVLLTRSTDVFIPLETRSAIANKQTNAIFVSIHFNQSSNSAASGLETFALAPRGVPSMGEDEVNVNAVRQYPGHARDSENILLAAAVHSSALRYCPLPDRGIKRARFHVIRETTIPAILVEGGFMNNSLDARMIANAAYRQRLAMAIAEGIMRFQRSVRERSLLPPPSHVASGADATTATPFTKYTPTRSISLENSPAKKQPERPTPTATPAQETNNTSNSSFTSSADNASPAILRHAGRFSKSLPPPSALQRFPSHSTPPEIEATKTLEEKHAEMNRISDTADPTRALPVILPSPTPSVETSSDNQTTTTP